MANHVEHKSDLQESLLGQALEGGPTIHTTPSNNVQVSRNTSLRNMCPRKMFLNYRSFRGRFESIRVSRDLSASLQKSRVINSTTRKCRNCRERERERKQNLRDRVTAFIAWLFLARLRIIDNLFGSR